VTSDIAESLGMDRARGALVAGVIRGGPVDDGSIVPGDVVIRFDGEDVIEMRDLPRIVAESPVGNEVDVTIIRNGEEMEVQVTLGRLEDGEQLAAAEGGSGEVEEAPVEDMTVLGMSLAELGDDAREQFGIADDVAGVVITEVDPQSEAAEKAIEAGEVIVEIAQETVSSPADVAARIERLRSDGRRNALLMIANATGELRFVTIRMD
jgi:serine protease Do